MTQLTATPPHPLLAGSHDAGQTEKACLWEAVNLQLTGELSDDCPPCTHPALHALLLRANDALGGAARQRLWPYAQRALGTAGRDSAEIAFVCADVAVRTFAADALDAAGLTGPAATLRALSPIVDRATARAARAAAAAADAADAARAAAYAADADAAAYAYAYAAAARAARAARAAVDVFVLLDRLLPDVD